MEESGKTEKLKGVARLTAQPPIVYFNIGWMERYAGPVDNDKTKGGHGYLQNHPHGGEASNFLKTEDGTCRGYRLN